MGHPADGKRAIALFGGAGIQVGAVPLGGRAAHRHPLAILALLVANAGRPITRDKLIALLWPERDTDAARNLLKVNVHELRKELGDAAIRSTGDQLSVDVAELSCDVTDFMAALAAGDDQRAVELYAGPFLDGFFLKDAAEFERWVEGERARFAQLYADALERLAARASSTGDVDGAVRWRRAQAALDPYHPEIAQRLMEALAAAGDRAGAIRFAESFTQRRHDELGIGDETNLVAQARAIAATYTPSVAMPRISPAAAPRIDEAPANVPAVNGAASPARSRRARFALVAVATVVVGGTGLLALRNGLPTTASSPARGRLAVAPFRLVGTDTSTRDAFVELLASRFTGEGGPASLDTRVEASSSAGGMRGASSLDDALRRARSLGAGEVLVGEIAGARDSIAVSARLYAVATGALIASARADASTGSPLATLADRVAVEIMARAAGEPEDRVGHLVARPIGAARAFIAGQLAYRSGRYAAAESLYARSLQADSTFGTAGLGLAMANSWTVINEHYGIGRDAAMRHLAEMSERDRLFALAFFGPDPALGSPQPAPVYLRRWEDLVEKYPDWTEAWYQVGDRYYHFGGLSGLADSEERARSAFRRALAQDSTFSAPLHHLVEIYAGRGELAELKDAGARYFAANPGVDRDASAIGWEIAMASGDSAWTRRVRANFERMPREELTRIAWVTDDNGWPRADAERAVTLADRKAGTAGEHERTAVALFALHENDGNAAAARAATAALGAQFPDRPVGAIWDLAGAVFGIGDSALAASAAARLADFAVSPVSGEHVRRDQHHLALCLTGYWRATLNDLAAARSSLERLASELRAEDNNFALRNGEVCRAMLAATIATNAHDADARRLVARLDTILLEQRVPPHAILEAGTLASARLHAVLGETASALVAARRREHLTGDPVFLATELAEEERFARATGDRIGADRAAKHLRALRADRASGRTTP